MKKSTKTHWVWTEKGHQEWERVKKCDEQRLPGQPVHEPYRTSCPLGWYEKGYVEEAHNE